LLLIAVSGCASVGPYALYRSSTANPDHDNRVMADYEVHRNSPVYQDVMVFEGDGQQQALEVIDGRAGRLNGADIEILGTFDLKPDNHTPWVFADYSAFPRKILCWPQVPLMWLSLGLWIAVPTSYFCWSRTPGKRETWLGWIKQLADSAGGNVAVVTFKGKGDATESATGYVIRTR
jgi:hypothetical protein